LLLCICKVSKQGKKEKKKKKRKKKRKKKKEKEKEKILYINGNFYLSPGMDTRKIINREEYLCNLLLKQPSPSAKQQPFTTENFLSLFPTKSTHSTPAMSTIYHEHATLLEHLSGPNYSACTFWNLMSSHTPVYDSFFELERSMSPDFIRMFIEELKDVAPFYPMLDRFDFDSAENPIDFLDAHPKLAFIYLYFSVPGIIHQLSPELKMYLFTEFLDDLLDFPEFAIYCQQTERNLKNLETIRVCFGKVLNDAQVFVKPSEMNKEDIERFCRSYRAMHLFHQLCRMLQKSHRPEAMKKMKEEVDVFTNSF
jgi:hypothetical protein